MSIIGSLEIFGLSAILQRVEAHAKSGLLLVKQGERGVEFYFQRGQLVCIGPLRSNTTLGERLLQAGVISQQALQEAVLAIGAAEPNETRMALTLIDLGYLSQERLYSWAAKEATQVLYTLLNWKTGEVYFEDGLHPPADRLLIALSVGSLLPSPASIPQPVMAEVTKTSASPQPGEGMLRTGIANTPTLFLESQFSPASGSVSASSLLATEAPVSPMSAVTGNTGNTGSLSLPALTPPRRVATPPPPRRIDTSFLLPQMILVSADLSGIRQQNPELQLTPEQWQLLARVDGHTSLQMMCQTIGMTSEMVCQIAGELIVLGLVTVTLPSTELTNETSSNNQAGRAHAYVAPAYTVATIEPRVVALPIAEQARSFSMSAPIETQSQWGNGGNGAKFVLGGGWVLASQPAQALPSSGQVRVVNPAYAHAGEVR